MPGNREMKAVKSAVTLLIVLIVFGVVFWVRDRKSNMRSDLPTVDSEITVEVYPKYGHAEDFSWVAGELKYQPLEGGCWTLVFSQNQETDIYNGVLALENVESHKLEDGEFVVVEGKVVGNEFSMACPPNIYWVTNID